MRSAQFTPLQASDRVYLLKQQLVAHEMRVPILQTCSAVLVPKWERRCFTKLLLRSFEKDFFWSRCPFGPFLARCCYSLAGNKRQETLPTSTVRLRFCSCWVLQVNLCHTKLYCVVNFDHPFTLKMVN